MTIPLSKAIILAAAMTGGGKRQSFYVNRIVYQVPVGKSLRVLAVKITQNGATGHRLSFGYGDTQVDDSGIDPVNAVNFQVGPFGPTTPTNSNVSTPYSGTEQRNVVSEWNTDFTVPAGKYLFCHQFGGAVPDVQIIVVGYLI